MCVCVRMHACVCIYIYTYLYLYIYIYIYMHAHPPEDLCPYICMYVCMYACMYACMFVYTHRTAYPNMLRTLACIYQKYISMDSGMLVKKEANYLQTSQIRDTRMHHGSQSTSSLVEPGPIEHCRLFQVSITFTIIGNAFFYTVTLRSISSTLNNPWRKDGLLNTP